MPELSSTFAKASADKKGLRIGEIKDSKLLLQDKREELSNHIKEHCLGWGIGVISEKVIDKINIHNASLLAMQKAVKNLWFSYSSEFKNGIIVAVDGKFTIPNLSMQQEAIIDGDNKILSIAAASIIAKVYRDNLMQKLHVKFPEYNFAQHKGYATQNHREAIAKFDLTPLHRLSFCGQYV